MDNTTVADRIRQTMSIVFEIPETEINSESSADTIDNWDSLRHLNLILGLEEEFGISIPDEEVGNLMNFKLIELIINDQLQ